MVATASKKEGRTARTIAATAATAAVACGVCCVLPLAIPAIALTSAGAAIAWFGSIHAWMTWIAGAAVAGGWLWVGLLAARSKAKTAPATLWWMTGATFALGLAVLWPRLEPILVAALTAR